MGDRNLETWGKIESKTVNEQDGEMKKRVGRWRNTERIGEKERGRLEGMREEGQAGVPCPPQGMLGADLLPTTHLDQWSDLPTFTLIITYWNLLAGETEAGQEEPLASLAIPEQVWDENWPTAPRDPGGKEASLTLAWTLANSPLSLLSAYCVPGLCWAVLGSRPSALTKTACGL